MFDENMVVASAISAFNNAAIVAPTFFWIAILGVPLFMAAYLFGHKGLKTMNLQMFVTPERMMFWTVVISAFWVVLMGGNYGVLRDGISLLPLVTGAILFVSSIFIGQNTRAIKLPVWYGAKGASLRRRWFVNILILLCVLVPVGLSDTLNWWGPILQVSAVILGLLFGRFMRWRLPDVSGTIFIMLAITSAMLMQPEFFRFGQLGNLTSIHLIWVLVCGCLFAAAMATGIIKPCGRIHQSAYVKLKWMMRVITLLCMILFILTEAVPIFLVAVASAFVMFAMSVWHAKSLLPKLPYSAMAWAMVAFGVLTGAMTITAMGALWIGAIAGDGYRGGAGFLL